MDARVLAAPTVLRSGSFFSQDEIFLGLDPHTTYLTMRLAPPKGVGLKISGNFPHARYLSFTSYDPATSDPHDAIADAELSPTPVPRTLPARR